MIESVKVFVLVSGKNLFLSRSVRLGRRGHTWTSSLKKAMTFGDLNTARKYVQEFALKYPYDEFHSKTLEGAWFRDMTIVPGDTRYEIFDDTYVPKAMLRGTDNEE